MRACFQVEKLKATQARGQSWQKRWSFVGNENVDTSSGQGMARPRRAGTERAAAGGENTKRQLVRGLVSKSFARKGMLNRQSWKTSEAKVRNDLPQAFGCVDGKTDIHVQILILTERGWR